MKLSVYSFKTNLGTFRCAATEKGLALLMLPRESSTIFEHKIKSMFAGYERTKKSAITKKTESEIKTYLAGHLRKFKVKLDLHATPFQERVLSEVAHIPYGETRTYSEIARAVGSPRAARAVGSANAKNPLPIVIPCHRVVAVNGLGGYGGGLAMKKQLLALES
ncbi:MAG: methylated-DNA--[protein]-cysteine S-methyltransferase [candidate division Zixibacteria bacterium]|nr:methylated-DNA--[protein]-cysteine S-methyltransferase [candidate division Zixibacteria bacterium]